MSAHTPGPWVAEPEKLVTSPRSGKETHAAGRLPRVKRNNQTTMPESIAPYRLPLDPNDAQRCICPLCQSLNGNAPMPTFAGPILQCDECGEHYFADDGAQR